MHAPPFNLLLTSGLLLLSGALCAQAPSGEAPLHQDLVQADYSTPAKRKTAAPFTRTVRPDSPGDFLVVITDAAGTVRMRGTFRDAAATIPHGLFTYYHANGQQESEGRFAHGLKSGTWHCWTSNGTARADRHYLGLGWEDLQVWLGLAERAATLCKEPVADALPPR